MSLFDWPVLPLAAFEQLGTVIAAVLGILYIIGQVMNRDDKGRAPQRRAAPRRRPAQAQRPVAQAGAGGRAAHDPRTEVERFLREVTARRGQQAEGDQVELLERPSAARPGSKPPPKAPAARGRGAGREAARRAPAPREELAEVEVVRGPLGSGVDDHVRTHLGPPLSGESMQQRVHEHLDHQLGTIGSQGAKPAQAAVEMPLVHPLSLLRSPTSLREAIVLSEILSEPVSLRPPRS